MTAAAPKSEPSVEERTRSFYDREGWVTDEAGVKGEDAYFRNTAPERAAYDEKIFRKPMELLADCTGELLIAGPGDFPSSHELAARHFDAVHCLDISERSLDLCKRKLGSKGRYRLGTLLELPFDDASVDAALCAHVLFHIHKDDQARAVSELIRVVKPGGRILFVYVNPQAPLMRIQRLLKFFRVHKLLKADKLYNFSHPPCWWSSVANGCEVAIHPYDIMSRNQMRALLPFAGLRRRAFDWASQFEDRNPERAAQLWSYIAIEINKPG